MDNDIRGCACCIVKHSHSNPTPTGVDALDPLSARTINEQQSWFVAPLSAKFLLYINPPYLVTYGHPQV